MSEEVKKTTITRVDESEDESDGSIGSEELDTDSDQDLEDNRFDTCSQVVSEEALTLVKDLYIKDHFNRFDIIETKSESVDNSAKVCHILLLNDKPNDNTVHHFSDSINGYIFKSKSKLEERVQQIERNSVKNSKTLVKSDIQLNIIPKTFTQFLEILFDLNSVLIEDKMSKLLFREETHNREIQFTSHDSYVNAFHPFVFREFWSDLKVQRKRDINSYEMTFQTLSDDQIVCTYIRDNACEQPVFKYAQVVVLNYKDSETKRFGLIKEVKTKLIDKTSDHLLNPLILSQTQTESQRNEEMFIFVEIIIVCKPLVQSLDTISVTPMACCQKYLLEARVVFELKEPKFSAIFAQILKPVFRLGVTGFSVDLEDREDLFDIQKDAIQKGYEICYFPGMTDCSSFVAINGCSKSGKTEILKETVLQLIKKAENKIKKLLVITRGTEGITSLIEFLKKNDIKVFHIDSRDDCLSHKKSDIKRRIKKLNKELLFEEIVGKKESFDQIMKYYKDQVQFNELSVRDKYVKETIDGKVVYKLITESNVIIGSIDDIMNNELFNSVYNCNDDVNIQCALVDNAHLYTETEILTLLYSGVKGFVLYGDSGVRPRSFEKCESFFQRYIRLFNKNYRQIVDKNYSVINIRDSIASQQRYHRNRKNYRNGNNFRHKIDANINQYRTQSNYGSEYFSKNSNRFKDNKAFKTEVKDESKPSVHSNHSFNRGMNVKYEQRRGGNGYGYGNYRGYGGRGGQRDNARNMSTSEPNLMTDGVISQMSYGHRDSYIDHQNGYNGNNQPNGYGINGIPGSDAYINSELNAQNTRSFTPNPNPHENYNLF